MMKIGLSDEIPEIPENIDPLLKSLILRCLERNPEKRPNTNELLSDTFFASLNKVKNTK